MEKQDLLVELKNQLEQGTLTQQEVESVFAQGGPVLLDEASAQGISRRVNIQDIVYYIGGAIVFIGLAVMIGQNWGQFNTVARLLITLGSATAAYVMAFIFNQRDDTQGVAQPFFMLSALLLPIGVAVALYESKIDLTASTASIIISSACLAVFGLSLYTFRSALHLVYTIIFSTWLFFGLTGFLTQASEYYIDSDFLLYRIFAVGLSYLLMGYYFSATRFFTVSGVLYFFGSLGVLSSALILGGWEPNQKVFWELIYPLLSLGIVFLSTQLKSRAMLVWGTIFFMAYLIKISAEYFADSVGWPAALIISGLAMIAVGYYAFRIKKQYIG
jgi:hypothetical protein